MFLLSFIKHYSFRLLMPSNSESGLVCASWTRMPSPARSLLALASSSRTTEKSPTPLLSSWSTSRRREETNKSNTIGQLRLRDLFGVLVGGGLEKIKEKHLSPSLFPSLFHLYQFAPLFKLGMATLSLTFQNLSFLACLVVPSPIVKYKY